jgi:uncharacterized protein
MRMLNAAILSVAISALVSVATAQTIQINRENKTIAISTSDEATATADIAAVTVGFEIFGPDSQSTYVNAGKLSQAILSALRKAGIEDKDIESSAQGLQRNTDFDEKEPADLRAKRQFVFRQSWNVSATPKSASEVIRVAIVAGANKTGEIEWRLSDKKSLQAKAAEAALVKARSVASQMAEGLGVKLGTLIYASNETPNTRLYFARPAQVAPMNTDLASVSSVLQSPALEIRPETIREEATVYAVFAIE